MTLTKAQKSALHKNIKAVLKSGHAWEDDSLHYPAGVIIDAITEIDGLEKADDTFETNGWEWDWWQQFTHNEKSYTLSGSGFYGGHTFSETEE